MLGKIIVISKLFLNKSIFRQRAACGWFYSPLHNNRPVVFAVGGDNEATAEVYGRDLN